MRYREEDGKICLGTREMTAFSLFHYIDGSSAEEGLPYRRADRGTLSSLGFSDPVPLSAEFVAGEHAFFLTGEADGLTREGNRLSLSVVFLVDEDPLLPGEKTVRAARGEAYLLAAMAAEKGKTVTLTVHYRNPATGACAKVTETPKNTALIRFFERAATAVSLYASSEIVRVSRRLPAMRALRFPFPAVRAGQEEMMKGVYRAVCRGGRLFACAPTGIGKTVSALYPAVRAMGEGKCDKIFYLTGKETAARMAAQTAELLGKGGALRTLLLVSKEKMCPYPGTPCREGTPCERSKTAAARIEEATIRILSAGSGVITPEEVGKEAAASRICPYELSLRVSMFCDLVICDYNYLFDPAVRLRRFFTFPGKWCFLVDEAHNLADRVRDMMGEGLSRAELQKLAQPFAGMENNGFLAALSEADAYFGTVLSGLADKEEKEGTVRRSLPEGLLFLLARLFAECGKITADYHIEPVIRRDVRKFSYKLQTILDIFSLYNDGFRLLIRKKEEDVSFRILCLDPAPAVSDALARGSSAVLFSATLQPLLFYRDLYGGDASSDLLDIPSPFERDRLAVAILDKIGTRYSEREETLSAVLGAIRATVEAKRGNYMVFCPSFPYLDAVLPLFRSLCPALRVIAQKRQMSPAERAAFLAEFEKPEDPVVAFCVLGGIYGEGVDLAGRRLIGAVIIGTGLPNPDLFREQIAAYYREKSENGLEYAYLYPGMNRVLQAAGRVIRTEEDRGVVVLIDDRYATPALRDTFPDHWHSAKYVGDERSLREFLRRFWQKETGGEE